MLDLADLRRSYGPVTALDGLTCHFPAGELVGFLGPNGAGKTTTMRIVMGLDRADAGRVTFEGRPVTPELRRAAGYLPEERGLYPKMAVGEQVELFARLRGLDSSTARAATTTWLDRVGLTDRRDDRLERLSQGNQQRVQLAVALIGEPDLLLLDEPFSSLDPIGTDLMRELLAERTRAGATVIFSSHQLDLVEDLCRAVVIVHAGRRVLEGAVDELRATGPQRLAVGTAPGWVCSVPGTRMLEPDHRFGLARVGLDPGADPQAVLADAQGAGEVWHFATELAPLSEVFRAAVARDPALDPVPSAG